MNSCHHCRRVSDGPPVARHVTLPGTREDALEHLPRLCRAERLELCADAISLVCRRSRVDVRVVAETGIDATRLEAPLVLLALAFEGRSEGEVDRFVHRLRERARRAATRH